MALLHADNLKKRFARRLVVQGITLKCWSGEIIGLLGRNGAGKTTTFLMIAGLLRPDGGRIYIDKNNISHMATPERAAHGITYLPQENSVFLKASVEGNLHIILEMLHLHSKGERERRVRSLLDELGLSELAKQSAHSLSGGERRRLEIARSLAISPRFLLLDEPFTGIDPLTIIELQKIFLALRAKNIGIILSDHNVRDTFKISDRVYIIDDGRILVSGPPREVADNPQARENFLGRDFKHGAEVRISPSD
jgi:lipopolysaccharide export system ATP-binding protein